MEKEVNRTDKARPTEEVYLVFVEAYDFFNQRLFGGQLPSCLLTLRVHGKSYGYFSAKRFASTARSVRTDEIAMNPKYFLIRPPKETLSTLVHEQTHLWQQHFDKPSRSGHHNKGWGQKMDSLGLTPSNTGKEGGKRTGGQMSHFIVEGGPFDRACDEFLGQGIALWGDVEVQLLPSGDPDGIPGLEGVGIEAPTRKPKNKVKYRCPRCDQQVWGKPGLLLACGVCKEEFQEAK